MDQLDIVISIGNAIQGLGEEALRSVETSIAIRRARLAIEAAEASCPGCFISETEPRKPPPR